MQQGILFHTLYAPQSGVYVEQLSCTLHGPLHATAFQQAWQHTVARHPVLRTAFYWEDLEKPLQVVHRQATLPWTQQDWRGLPPAVQQTRFETFLQADRVRGFALEQAPLMRCALFELAAERFYFVWSHHHLLLDGWSVPLLLQEVLTCYHAF